MEQQQDLHSCLVIWRGQKFVVEMNPSAPLKELGEKLQELTNVKADTLRLLVRMEKSSKLLYPFSNEHSCLSLDSASVLKGRSIRMMGVPKNEVDEVLENAKVDLRIAGFDEEEKRLKQRNGDGSYALPRLPQGPYIFGDFRTLSLPGVELNPPASRALELLHRLASDPGIVAIMNKHRWRVGILTEMAPVGYVGVSPKCILGFNKNHGEEISLRLRTDDLKGFRKYESIKKTLLHELAHMVFGEHDANFYALDKQLNEEAATLDWSKSKGHTLSGITHSRYYEEELGIRSHVTSSQKLGGQAHILQNARAASVNAALERLANTSTMLSSSSEERVDSYGTDGVQELTAVPDPVVHVNQKIAEPDPDDCEDHESMVLEPSVESRDSHMLTDTALEIERYEVSNPENSGFSPIGPNSNGEIQRSVAILEPELDDSGEEPNDLRFQNKARVDQVDFLMPTSTELPSHISSAPGEPHSNDYLAEEMQTEYDPGKAIPRIQNVEPDPDDTELQIIQDPVTLFCGRLQSAIQSLKSEVKPSETGTVLQTLIKIIRNVIEHPDEVKFKKLRKANPMIQRNIITYKAAVDILRLIGFSEDVIMDEWGKAEAFLMLKRNDPGLLWLAKSSLETYAT
ncbi:uncharacterized protein LOC105167449 isoform X1 [Sesamum indicum]|uniref:Uncharacterized protein LOC105167449 isoform X1 n=1 Tax=Sesamum indicum TaxID=4182 RepID=A0A6I9TIL9_SESIN|nr:uncharacterized protein LOC105167449 isoform X1 [Sesamum indicum]XP_011085480.1 uncharacterized protein LOC105167449 isoform X1 [Sesamum indicum]XP_011085481.1 uncharacterized protein LOC105167449 isoform X1 [Sesamum indicum]XP_020551285.1 uncharacterized protein LOC105167449 isoform X1 [Sesamum indicum]